MAFLFNNRQRNIIPQVIEALQQIEDDPQRLDLERDSEPPPPYRSGETTQPPSPEPPGPPAIDQYVLRQNMLEARGASRPAAQFKSQTNREHDRLLHQLDRERSGRKQTLPFDMSMDLQANADNNVRSRWVKQGIWMDDWGPAWPKGSEPLSINWTTRPERYPEPGAYWGHEKKPEKQPSPALEPKETQRSKVFTFGASKPKQSEAASKDAASPPQPKDCAETSPRDSEASRPFNQFFAQMDHEREWIKDELQYNRTSAFDIDRMVYESVKKNWIEDDLWIPEWDDLPGMAWRHEHLMPEGLPESPSLGPAVFSEYPRIYGSGYIPAADSQLLNERPDNATSDSVNTKNTQSAGCFSFGRKLAPEVDAQPEDENVTPNGTGKAEESEVKNRPSPRETQASSPPAVDNEAQYPEQLRDPPPKNVDLPGEQMNLEQTPSASYFRVQNQMQGLIQPFVGSAQASHSGASGKKRVLVSDEDNEFREERSSKPPPTKRPRRGGRGQGHTNPPGKDAIAHTTSHCDGTQPVVESPAPAALEKSPRRSARVTARDCDKRDPKSPPSKRPKRGGRGHTHTILAGRDAIANITSHNGHTQPVVDSPVPSTSAKPPPRRSARIAARQNQSRDTVDKPNSPHQRVTQVTQASTVPLRMRQPRSRMSKVEKGSRPTRNAGNGKSRRDRMTNTNRRRRQ